MSSFLVLSEGDTRNKWRDGQVCPDVELWRLGPDGSGENGEKDERDGKRRERRRKEKGEETAKVKKNSRGEREEPALYGEKG
ncbi:hypothetical protein TNCV_4363791 [Trichonephila clavipes]|nr:hypothetical protein TNCV_4363791 [Trichonephila clavipes]